MSKQMKPSGIGWIKEIPQSWELNKVKYLATEQGTLFLDGDWIESDVIVESGIRYLTTGNVGAGFYKEQGSGYITLKTFDELHCLKVFPGDLMISRLNEPIGRACIVPEGEDYYVVAVDNVILRPNRAYDKKFIMYAMNTEGYAEHGNIIARGATMSRVSRSQLGQFWLAFPKLKEQQQIAAFLDDQCAKIDGIIADIEKQIATLQKYKKSLITETVTKGLDKSVSQKESSVSWIGTIPQAWKACPVGYMSTSRSGGTPDRNNLEYWENGTIPWMASGEVNKVNVYDTDERITLQATYNSSAKIVKKNSVMVALNGQGKTKGMSAILRIDSACNQSLCAFSCFENVLYYEYLFWCFQSMYTYLRQMSGDAVRDGLAASYVRKQKIPVPPFSEQQEIAEYLNKKCRKIDEIMVAKQTQLKTIQQHKKSLIYEYVTGKKRVTEVN